MQTINDMQKYKLQQLFEMLSLSLDTGLESILVTERDYVTFACLLPQIRLYVVFLSVTSVRLTQEIEAFGNISSPLCNLAIL